MNYLLLACLGLLIGCGSSQDTLVAEVGSHQISARLLRLYVQDLTEGLRTKMTGDEARHHYLQALVDRRLLLLEASDRGLDTASTFNYSVQDDINARARAIYRAQNITGKAKVTPEEVRRYYDENGYARERLLNAIKVASRAAADSVLQALQEGGSFAEIANERSLDERSAKRGGELGFVGQDLLESLHIPPDVFDSLPQDQLSEPLPAGPAWHIVRFTEDRPASYERYQAGIASLLYRQRRAEIEIEHFEQLKESFRLRLQPEALAELIDAFKRQQPAVLEGNSTVLYTYKGGEVTLGQVQDLLRRRNISYGFTDSVRATTALDYYFLKPRLLEVAARKEGIYDTPEMRQFSQRTRDDALLEALRGSVIAGMIDFTPEEVRHYYDTHLETFRHGESVWVEEVLLPSRDGAQEVKTQIEAGAPFAQFVNRSLRENARKNKGEYHYHKLGKALYPVLVPAIFAAAEGQLQGPMEVKGGFSVFRVLRREPSNIEPFETAQRRATALVRLEQENQSLSELLVQLRQKYAAETKIYSERLKEALPDSLLVPPS